MELTRLLFNLSAILTLLHVSDSALNDRRSRLLFHNLDGSECASSRTEDIVLTEAGGTVPLRLQLVESSRDFLPTEFEIDSSLSATLLGRPCYYQGIVAGTGELATAKLVDGMFSATFSYNGRLYEVLPNPQPSQTHPQNRLQPQKSPLPASVLPPSPTRKCGSHSRHHQADERSLNRVNSSSGMSGSDIVHRRGKRSVIRADTNSLTLPENRKYIRLILVGDAAFYNGMGKSATRTSDRLWEIGNLVNGLYKQLGVNVIIVKTLVWTIDPFHVNIAGGGVNASELLNQFLTYRMKSLNDTPHTVAHLVSGYPMVGGLVGLACLGKLCHFSFGGGVNWDTQMNGSAYGVATTVAHELGHNLGMEHDDEGNRTSVGCGCPDPQGCMMQSSGGESDPVRFSTCSVNSYLEFSVPNGLGYCMNRPPDASVTASSAASICGNRIVETGEDCDCGLTAYCNSTCCNPSTCKFKPGATCASGQCCNTTSCSVMPRGSVCRASKGVCDLPEYCNGTSEWCPEFDDFLLDGTDCAYNPANASQVQAYCYNGECGSRDARCSRLFVGVVISATSTSASTASTAGNETGYCEYRAIDAAPLSYQYFGCLDSNQRCGTLYCSNPSSTAPSSNWLSMDDDDIRTVGSPAGNLVMAMLDLTPSGFRDPGLVPDGAECGRGMVCVSSVCQTLSTVIAAANPSAGQLPNCNGRGRSAQSRQCFCNAGFAPPNCLTAGAGGSIANQPAMAAGDVASTVEPTKASSTTTIVIVKSNAATLDNLAYLGIGIGVGIAAACILALIVGLAVWACRRSQASDIGNGNSQQRISTIDGSGGAASVATHYSSDRLVSGSNGGFDASIAERRV